MTDLTFLVDWYVAHCDGDWEHQNGVTISTLDNPGWHLNVNIEDTELEGSVIDLQTIERSEHDWIHYRCDGREFDAACGPRNLAEAMTAFEEFARTTSSRGG